MLASFPISGLDDGCIDVKSEYQDLRRLPFIPMLPVFVNITAESLNQFCFALGRTSPRGDVQKCVGTAFVVTVIGTPRVFTRQGIKMSSAQECTGSPARRRTAMAHSLVNGDPDNYYEG